MAGVRRRFGLALGVSELLIVPHGWTSPASLADESSNVSGEELQEVEELEEVEDKVDDVESPTPQHFWKQRRLQLTSLLNGDGVKASQQD